MVFLVGQHDLMRLEDQGRIRGGICVAIVQVLAESVGDVLNCASIARVFGEHVLSSNAVSCDDHLAVRRVGRANPDARAYGRALEGDFIPNASVCCLGISLHGTSLTIPTAATQVDCRPMSSRGAVPLSRTPLAQMACSSPTSAHAVTACDQAEGRTPSTFPAFPC